MNTHKLISTGQGVFVIPSTNAYGVFTPSKAESYVRVFRKFEKGEGTKSKNVGEILKLHRSSIEKIE